MGAAAAVRLRGRRAERAIPRRGRDAYDYAAEEALDFGLDVDPADPVPTAEDIPAAFAERGVLAWRDTFESV